MNSSVIGVFITVRKFGGGFFACQRFLGSSVEASVILGFKGAFTIKGSKVEKGFYGKKVQGWMGEGVFTLKGSGVHRVFMFKKVQWL